MYKSIWLIVFVLLVSCKATTYYIVRHAEKEPTTTMTSDVPLSDAGRQRAQALRMLLQNGNIRHIFSTNYIRTRSTVQPLADALHLPVEIYDPKDTTFISKLKALKGNVLVVGHSNTVDDLVNSLSGRREVEGDLADSQYGDLFIVKKKGSRLVFEKKHFGN
jgi:2,3-bisphosphoglycerate-dependent phosphoglycerate mutase